MSIHVLTGLPLSGKKSLLAGAEEEVARSGSKYYLFIKPDVLASTLPPNSTNSTWENVTTDAEFNARKERNEYIVEWAGVNGATYALRHAFLKELRRGRKAILSLPIHVIFELERKLTEKLPLQLILVSATNDILQQRIKAVTSVNPATGPLSPSSTVEDATTKEERKKRAKVLSEQVDLFASFGLGKIALSLPEKEVKNTNANSSSSSSNSNANSNNSSNNGAELTHGAVSLIGDGQSSKCTVTILPNQQTIPEGVQSLLSLLNFNFAFEAQRAQQFDPLTCSAEQYLAHIIFPTLNESLTVLDRIRPEDPVEFLAVYLQQKATEEKQHKLELEEIHNLREKLRNTIKQEYNVQGRA